MRSAVPLFRTPATPWAMMRSPRRTAATMPKRSAPLPSIVCRMASTLTGALPSIFPAGKPAGLNVSNLGASLMFHFPERDAHRSGLQEAPVNEVCPRRNHALFFGRSLKDRSSEAAERAFALSFAAVVQLLTQRETVCIHQRGQVFLHRRLA